MGKRGRRRKKEWDNAGGKNKKILRGKIKKIKGDMKRDKKKMKEENVGKMNKKRRLGWHLESSFGRKFSGRTKGGLFWVGGEEIFILMTSDGGDELREERVEAME